MTEAGAASLTPVQLRTLEALRRTETPVVFDRAFVDDLRAGARQGLTELGARLEGDLWVTKFNVAGVLQCETHYLDPGPFAWNPAIACGQVSHRAIQLLLNWRGEPTPADLVDEAIARLADEERGIGEWMAALGPADEADLRGRAIERVTQFVECFPPLSRTWHPMTEAAVQWPGDGPILLRARVDLVIGRPAGVESRKVLIDFKSGRVVDRHREDLRFYALVETLAREVPPRSVASFSLEAGEAVVDQVSESMLWSSLRRTLDAIARMIELTVEGRSPSPPPSAGCFRCRELRSQADRRGDQSLRSPSSAAEQPKQTVTSESLTYPRKSSADHMDLVADGQEVVHRGSILGPQADAARRTPELLRRADALG